MLIRGRFGNRASASLKNDAPFDALYPRVEQPLRKNRSTAP
jgi:hypothetical protein